MNKFALVGRNISHSRSPEIYRKIISTKIDYDLLDYQTVLEIPTARDLLNIYDGINITSPYKKHFLNQVELTPVAKESGAINCLKKYEGNILGENTDYLAISEIFKKMLEDYKDLDVVILGDGVMANVTKSVLTNLKIRFRLFSRKLTPSFYQLDLVEYFKKTSALPVVINTCSRDFIFNGKIPKTAFFWDYNYNFNEHSATLPNKVYKYVDGLELLERQAFYAVAFWSA